MDRTTNPAKRAELCGWLSFVGPLAAGIWSASGWPRFEDDLAVLRDLGGVPMGGGGVLSMVLAHGAGLLPVGSQLLRASWVGVVALALTSRLVFELTRRVLARGQWASASLANESLVALLAALAFAFEPNTVEESVRLGGSAVPLLLFVGHGFLLNALSHSADVRLSALAGALVGVGLLECPPVGLAMVAATLFVAVRSSRWVSSRGVALFVAALLWSLVVGSSFYWVRPLSRHGWMTVDVGSFFGAQRDSGLPVEGLLDWGIALWNIASDRLGWPLLAASIAGLAVMTWRSKASRALVGVGSLVAFGALQPCLVALGLPRAGHVAAGCLTAGLLVGAALGVVSILSAMHKARLPYIRPVEPLVLVLGATVVLKGLDRLPDPDLGGITGAEAWTDDALRGLPAQSLLVLRREQLAYRLWAASVLHRSRPDVVVVPTRLVDRGTLAEHLVRLEPEVAPLLRQWAIHHKADEYSLSRLSDVRPLHVELDSSWDERLLQHVKSEGLWLRFYARGLGRAEREEALESSQARVQALLDRLAPNSRNEVARQVIAGSVHQAVLVVAGLGERASAESALAWLEKVDPQRPVVAQLRERLDQSHRGRVDVADLIH